MYTIQMVSTTHCFLKTASWKTVLAVEWWAAHTFPGQGGRPEPPVARSSSSELGKEPRKDAGVRWVLASAGTSGKLCG